MMGGKMIERKDVVITFLPSPFAAHYFAVLLWLI
jgi:hypothetical protein